MLSLDDEVLPYQPTDVATPFILKPGAATSSVFSGAIYPTQDNEVQVGKAGELRGLYGSPGALQWRPEWSAYRAARPAKPHWGVDIYAPPGTELIAVVDGELSFNNQPKGLGLYARLRFTIGGAQFDFHYGHLSAAVGADRTVVKGAVIGRVGCSGNAGFDNICDTPVPGKNFSSSHVHFALLPPETTQKLERSNPLTVLGWELVTPPRPTGIPFV